MLSASGELPYPQHSLSDRQVADTRSVSERTEAHGRSTQLELLLRYCFSQTISWLCVSPDVEHCNLSCTDLLSNKVVFYVYMFCSLMLDRVLSWISSTRAIAVDRQGFWVIEANLIRQAS